MNARRLAALIGAAALLAAIVALLAWPAPGDPRARAAAGPSAGVRARTPLGLGDGGAAAMSERDRLRAGGAGEPGPGSPTAEPSAAEEATEAVIDRNVRELLGVLAPEIDLAELDRACTADGRHCTFTGPWPGDDLLVRWIRAQGSGEVSREELEGVTFSRFRREQDEEGRPIFVLQAHAPEANPTAGPAGAGGE